LDSGQLGSGRVDNECPWPKRPLDVRVSAAARVRRLAAPTRRRRTRCV
jgi:hypothetical protein